jgi:subtilisin family serine protease
MRKALRSALVCSLLTASAFAEQRFIVQTTLGGTVLTSACALLGCRVRGSLGDPAGQVFLLTWPDLLDVTTILSKLKLQAGVVEVEPDQVLRLADVTSALPDALFQADPVEWFGSTTRYGFVAQPSAVTVRLLSAQLSFGVTGVGIVAVIDTGVDSKHPELRDALLPGYDFIRNIDGSADEKGDVTQSTTGVVDNGRPFFVSETTAALLDSATALLIGTGNSAFGHGTMVAGIVHLTAPGTQILPLKAFRPDGTGYLSDVVHALYYASRHGARVVNMSFTFATPSAEFRRAVDYATSKGAICVAAAGNGSSASPVYPAAYNNVMAIASTGYLDSRSSFSNYGSTWIWIAAPGEGIVTTYPFNTFAAGWGTSFSAPFVAGTISLLLQTTPDLDFAKAASAVAQGQPVSPEMGHGRLDVYRAVQASITAH